MQALRYPFHPLLHPLIVTVDARLFSLESVNPSSDPCGISLKVPTLVVVLMDQIHSRHYQIKVPALEELVSKKDSSQMDLLVYDDQVEASVPHR
jgi:hypothetical protein